MRFKIQNINHLDPTPSAARAFSFATAHTELYDSRPKGYKQALSGFTTFAFARVTHHLNKIAKDMSKQKQPSSQAANNNTMPAHAFCLCPMLLPCPIAHCPLPIASPPPMTSWGGEGRGGGMDRFTLLLIVWSPPPLLSWSWHGRGQWGMRGSGHEEAETWQQALCCLLFGCLAVWLLWGVAHVFFNFI